jgi:hypothetical protein
MTQADFVQALESELQLQGVPFDRAAPDPTPITDTRGGGAGR